MVSVITPIHNYGRYIPETLQSLLSQTYTDWECVIIDDGSSDNTKSIVEDWIKKDNRIKYFFQPNAGPSVARNNGIRKSSGDYILFLDADDLLEKNKLKSHVEVLDQHDTIDIAYGEARYFTETKRNELLHSLKPDNKPWITTYSGKGNKLVDIVLRQNIMVISSPLIRRSILQKTGTFDIRLFKLEDWELFQRLAISGATFQYVTAPQSLVLVRIHPTSLSYDKKSMQSYLLPILEKHLSQSKLSFKNKAYVFLRMLEEYSDILLSVLRNSSSATHHYYRSYKYLLPLICFLLFPVVIAIKIFRLFNSFHKK